MSIQTNQEGTPDAAAGEGQSLAVIQRNWAVENVNYIKSICFLYGHMQKESAFAGWSLKDHVEDDRGVPIVLHCVRARIKSNAVLKDDTPVFFTLNERIGLYEEAPDLYGPMWNPESRKLQEMLAAGAPLQARYEQFQKQRRGKEAGK